MLSRWIYQLPLAIDIPHPAAMKSEPTVANQQLPAAGQPLTRIVISTMNTTTPPIQSAPSAARSMLNLRAFGTVLLAMIALVVVGILGTSLFRSASHKAMMHAHREQIEFIARLSALHRPHDAARAKELCTVKGYQVWARSSGYIPGAKEGFEIVGFGKSGDLCDVAMVSSTVEGVTKLYIRLVRSGSTWRYEDIYLKEAGGREIGLWASFVQEHPILASAKVLQPEIKAAYTEAKAALKGTAETVHDVATIVSIFKGL